MNSYKERKENKELFNNIQFYGDSKVFYMNNPGYFFAISDLAISNGIDIVKNIVIFSEDNENIKKENNNEYNKDNEYAPAFSLSVQGYCTISNLPTPAHNPSRVLRQVRV